VLKIPFRAVTPISPSHDALHHRADFSSGLGLQPRSWDKTVRIWDLAMGEPKPTPQGHTSWVSAVGITPDGCHVISGSNDKTLRVWDLATGKNKTILQGHTNWITALAVTVDGRHVVSSAQSVCRSDPARCRPARGKQPPCAAN
jgi:WD40 repeat protein